MKIVDIHGVPLDLGANIRGSNMGPPAIRIAGLHRAIKNIGYQPREMGDLINVIREQLTDKDAIEKYLATIAEACELIASNVEKSCDSGAIPLTIGGDHSFAIGSISGVASHFKKKRQKIGLIWIDAHADLNTPQTSPSGNIHGMPLAALLGKGHKQLTDVRFSGPKVKPENVALLGIRSIDAKERQLCKDSGINYYSMREIDERGILDVMKEAVERTSAGTAGIHVSFDLDAVDPIHAPGVSTPVSGGLSYREAHLCLECVADSGKLTSFDMVELNPITDQQHKTANLSVELIQSALGKSII